MLTASVEAPTHRTRACASIQFFSAHSKGKYHGNRRRASSLIDGDCFAVGGTICPKAAAARSVFICSVSAVQLFQYIRVSVAAASHR